MVSSWWSPSRDTGGGGGPLGRFLSLFCFRRESCNPASDFGTLALGDTPTVSNNGVESFSLASRGDSLDQGSAIFLAGNDDDPGSFNVDLAVRETLRT